MFGLSISPVERAKTVSPSKIECVGNILLAIPSCALIAILLSVPFESLAFVAMTPIVVFLKGLV